MYLLPTSKRTRGAGSFFAGEAVLCGTAGGWAEGAIWELWGREACRAITAAILLRISCERREKENEGEGDGRKGREENFNEDKNVVKTKKHLNKELSLFFFEPPSSRVCDSRDDRRSFPRSYVLATARGKPVRTGNHCPRLRTKFIRQKSIELRV